MSGHTGSMKCDGASEASEVSEIDLHCKFRVGFLNKGEWNNSCMNDLCRCSKIGEGYGARTHM